MRGDVLAQSPPSEIARKNEVTVRLVREPRQDAARKLFQAQAAAIAGLAERLDGAYSQAIDVLMSTVGHVVVSGMGKSGHVGRKVAATFASTGTPSFFVHPAEAHHGDLGMITSGDTVLLISSSGETQEIVGLLPHLRRMRTRIVALVGKRDSTLGREADVALDTGVDREACPLNLAPTNSTLAALAMGDVLAVSLMRERNFMARDFARVHPGGSLGRRLLTRVRDGMHKQALPIVRPDDSVGESLIVMTQGRLGLLLVMDGDELLGLVTDGDLRRAMLAHPELLALPVSRIMTTEPVTIDENASLAEADVLMQNKHIKAVVALDESGRVSGVLDIFQSS